MLIPIFGKPHEVSGECILQIGIAGLAESQSLLWPLAPAHVGRDRRYELEVVGVEAKNPQDPGETSEIAVDDLLQVRHAAAPPVLEALRLEQTHIDQDIDRSHDLATGEQLLDGARNPRIQLVVTECVDADARSWVRAPLAHRSPL